MKFAIGDRVVRVNKELTPGVPVGKAGTVIVFEPLVMVLWDGVDRVEPSFSRNLEREDVYESPLYQALL